MHSTGTPAIDTIAVGHSPINLSMFSEATLSEVNTASRVEGSISAAGGEILTCLGCDIASEDLPEVPEATCLGDLTYVETGHHYQSYPVVLPSTDHSLFYNAL